MDLLFFLLGECPNGSTSLNKGLNRCSPPHVMGGACAPKPPGTYRFLERNRRKRPPFEISHRPGRRNPFIVNATAPINSTPPPPSPCVRGCAVLPSHRFGLLEGPLPVRPHPRADKQEIVSFSFRVWCCFLELRSKCQVVATSVRGLSCCDLSLSLFLARSLALS